MSDQSVELDDFFDSKTSTKSDALANLDRAAIIGTATFVVLTAVVISLAFLSL